MLTLPHGARIFIAREPTDMRKAFDGLCGLVIEDVGQDPQSGHIFVFFNRRRDRVKILVWENGGYWLHYKRLEKGQFAIFDRVSESSGSFVLDGPELLLILEGLDLRGAKKHERYSMK